MPRPVGGGLRGVRRPGLDEALFSLAPGGVSAVVQVAQRDRTLYHLFRLLELRPARRIPWSEARPEIVRGLEEHPVESLEVLQWNRILEGRYPVVYGSAFAGDEE